MKLLVDTSALLALMMPRDRHHARAARFVRDSPHARFVLTELILAETVTRARACGSAEQAVATADRLLRSRRYELVLLDEDLLREALEQMTRFADKRLSLTDCASCALMERLGLAAAFSFDSDFRNCGYQMVP